MRGVGQLLDATVSEFVRHFVPMTTIGVLVAVPIQLLFFAIERSSLGLAQQGIALFLTLPVMIPAQLVVHAFAFAIVGGELTGRPCTPLEAAALAIRKLPALMLLMVVSMVLTVMTCGVGAILTQWLLAPAVGLVVLEEVRIQDLARRTVQLASGWGSFGRWVGMVVVISVVLGLLGPLEVALEEPAVRGDVLARLPIGPEALGWILLVLGAGLTALNFVVTGISMVVFYLDLCVRRAGLDLSRQLDQFESERRVEGVV